MIPISKSKLWAIAWLILVLGVLKHRNSPYFDQALLEMGAVFLLLWLPSVVSLIFSRGLSQSLARDHGTPIQLDMVSLVLWLGYLILGSLYLFNWSIY